MKKRKYLFHFIMNMEIVKKNKGGSKLCFEGYTYTKKSVSKATIQWECSQRKAYVCKGKVTTDSQVARVIRTIEHTKLKEDIPEGLEPLVDYFDATYISIMNVLKFRCLFVGAFDQPGF